MDQSIAKVNDFTPGNGGVPFALFEGNATRRFSNDLQYAKDCQVQDFVFVQRVPRAAAEIASPLWA